MTAAPTSEDLEKLDNIVYIGNVLSSCTEQDMYKIFCQFGLIKRIKIFCEIFRDVKYPIGYAIIEFADNSGARSCKTTSKYVSFHDCLFHIHQQKPETRFASSIFIFFSSDTITREFLMEYFANLRPSGVTVKSPIAYDRLGFAIVEFPSVELRDLAFSLAEEAPFQIVAPSPDIIDMWGTNHSTNEISFCPDMQSLLDSSLYRTFFDLEVIHCETPYRVNRFMACCYSKRINQLVLSNALLDRVESRLNVEGPFELVASSLLGQKIEIQPDNAEFVFLMAADFGMDELMKAASGIIYARMTPMAAMSLYQQLEHISLSDGPHIQYMAAHVDEMRTHSEFTSAPVELLSAVFHNKWFHTEKPEMFCEWLLGFVKQKQEERMKLLQFMIVESMTGKAAIDLVQDQSININLIRTPLLRFLQHGVQVKDGEYEIIDCHQQQERPSLGIFATLCERCNGNPQDFGMVKVTCNTTVEHVIEPGWKDYWSTPSIPNSWICFDMKKYEIKPSAYSIRSMAADTKLPYLMSWRLEGSKDNMKWDVLDEQRQSALKPELRQWRPYPIDTVEQYRYLKLTQIDKNASGNFCMFLYGLEFFGELPNQKENIKYEEGKEFAGVFAYITKCEQGNPASKGKIDITTSSDPKYLLDYRWEGCWRSPKKEDSYVLIDMMDWRVTFDRYSLRSHYGPSYIQSWKVEVAGDDEKYILVDQKTNREEYKLPNQTLCWTCTQPYPDPVRYIKFTITGPTKHGEVIFWLTNIELFGNLFRPARLSTQDS